MSFPPAPSMSDDEPLNECEEVGEHRDYRLNWEGDGTRQYECRACGAEWFEDEDGEDG